MLEITNLSYSYDNNKDIFSNVFFSLEKGSILSILGTNGAGKSTLLNCIANLFTPHTGTIKINGEDISLLSLSNLAKNIGYVPQIHNPTYDFKVIDFVVMGRTPYIPFFSKPSPKDYEIANNALKELNIEHLTNKIYTQISGGQRQQVTIARVVAQNPKIILLDEPTAHLDFGNQLRAIELVRKLSNIGYTIIMTTHMPDHIFHLGGYVGILDNQGKFKMGKPEDIMTSQTLSKLYDIDISTYYSQEAKRTICIPIK